MVLNKIIKKFIINYSLELNGVGLAEEIARYLTEKDKIYLKDIFKFKQTGVDEQTNKIIGEFVATGYVPEEIIQKAKENFLNQYPTLNFTYVRNGYFDNEDSLVFLSLDPIYFLSGFSSILYSQSFKVTVEMHST